jgi:hypothetical protein
MAYNSGSQPVGRDPLVGRVALPGGSWMLPQKAKKMIDEVFFVGYFLLGYYFDAILCGLVLGPRWVAIRKG